MEKQDIAYYAGIDIGSTATKVVLKDAEKLLEHWVVPTGWSSKQVAEDSKRKFLDAGYDLDHIYVVSTGYGRATVDYADKAVTEITCHGRGGYELMGEDGTMIDIGGQDTKIITVEQGRAVNFLMNDKCSAGTGKFLEVMANRLGVDLGQLFAMADQGEAVKISSTCTVFAESEVVSHIGSGTPREDIAAGIVDSVIARVANLASRHGIRGQKLFLTGGLCDSPYILKCLSRTLGQPVQSHPLGRFAGALGAALLGQDIVAKQA